MHFPIGSLELEADEPNDLRSQRSPRWMAALFLALLATMVVGIIVVSSYLGRPKHHPEFYGDYRGGYARGLDLRAEGLTKHNCEAGLSGPYASPTTFPAIQAKGIYLVGCTRGAKGKPIGDYVSRVDSIVNDFND